MTIVQFIKDSFHFEYFFDDAIGKTHAEDHGISFNEIYHFFNDKKYLEFKRKDGSFESIGFAGKKSIKAIYRKVKITKPLKHYFIISAFPVEIYNDEIDIINERINHEK